ncbi:hypothetical protein KGF56_002440 [Candida oxycetoniae]|uniref:Uncharacterized protein n=1 Tax=Candida oxycetoniae TaxID=497107 RepID=A0AAI9SX48_9ASCO|nr:uncharacterized protein KGF56_002440 [Candida oxycetoniae]KAI3404737.2 hypothetical protein KGF56_002440 [Candida oxycetoniae]
MSEEHLRESINDVHPVELTAHTVLSGPLDSLNASLASLDESQMELLTKLKLLEDRLTTFKKLTESNFVDEKQLSAHSNKVKEFSKRLSVILKQLDKLEARVDKLAG